MNPGFLSLFSRSLYRGSVARLHLLEPGSEEHRRVHEERERFAAAAIAFCLQHDNAFLWHFWRKVCRKTREPKPSTKPTVEIEPRHWSDLLLKWERILCAVEIKIGAVLADHQNPNKRAFSRQNGYGHFLSRLCRERKRNGRYVVFGWEPEIAQWSKRNILGLEIEQRQWADLESGMPSTGLTNDLALLLSNFGIWEFTFRAMKKKKLSGELGDFGSAAAILESVRDKLGWPPSCGVIVWRDQLGIHLPSYYRKKAIKGLAERLKRDNDVSEVAWFGYLARPDEPAQRCVYVYCSKERRNRLVKRLKATKFVVDEQQRDGDGEKAPYCVIVWKGKDQLDDITWFEATLEAAGGTSPERR